MKSNPAILFLLACVFLASCANSTATPLPTLTFTPEPSPAPAPSQTHQPTATPTATEIPLPDVLADKFRDTGYEPFWRKDRAIILVDLETGEIVPEITFDPEGNWTRAYQLPDIEEPFVVTGALDEIEIIVSEDNQVSLGVENWEIENGEFKRKTAEFATETEGITVELELTSLEEVHFEILKNSSEKPEDRIDSEDTGRKLSKKLFKAKSGIYYNCFGMHERSYNNMFWFDNIIAVPDETGELKPVETALFAVAYIRPDARYGLVGWIDKNGIGQVRIVDKAGLNKYSNFSDWYLTHKP